MCSKREKRENSWRKIGGKPWKTKKLKRKVTDRKDAQGGAEEI